MRLFPILIVAACSAPEPAAIALEPEPQAAVPMPPPGDLTVIAESALMEGEDATFRIEGATPGDLVYLGVGWRGLGAGPCPPVLDGLCLDLVRPAIAGASLADADGRAMVVVPLPDDLPDELAFQAATGGPPASTSDPVLLPVERCGYVGGWPCNPDADAILDPGWGGVPAVGDTWPRMTAPDQYGDIVDTYHLLGGGVPTLVVVVAAWSVPDNAYVHWLTGGDEPWWGVDWTREVPDAILTGDLRLVIMLQDGVDGRPAEGPDAADYTEHFALVDVPVLADTAQNHLDWLDLWYYPTAFVVDASGVVLHLDGDDAYSAVPFLEGLL